MPPEVLHGLFRVVAVLEQGEQSPAAIAAQRELSEVVEWAVAYTPGMTLRVATELAHRGQAWARDALAAGYAEQWGTAALLLS
jgi:hypothetical protein